MKPVVLTLAATFGLCLSFGAVALGQAMPGGTPGKSTPVPAMKPNRAMESDTRAVTDVDYASMQAESDMYEIRAGNLATETSSREDIKSLAKTIVADHTASSAELLEILGKTGPSLGDELDDKHQAMISALSAAKGADFDKLYLDQQISAHREALAVNQTYAASGSNNDLKRLAEKVIPKIQMHLDMALKLGRTG